MQGVHVFERHAKTVIDLESFVEQDHLLRKIDRVLDTAFVRGSTGSIGDRRVSRGSVASNRRAWAGPDRSLNSNKKLETGEKAANRPQLPLFF
jgi:hypothetical protein